MKIHTDKLKVSDLENAAAVNDSPDGGVSGDITFHLLGEAGSRSHRKAYDVALRGHGSRHTKPPQTKILADDMGGERERAATYDDWGWFIREVFVLDPNAKVGNYLSRADFDVKTDWKFA